MAVTLKRRQFVFRPFTPDQIRRRVGQAVLEAEIARIKEGRNVHGMPSRSLTITYARRKLKRGGDAIRNLLLSGRTLKALMVKSATSYKIVLGTDNSVVRLILLAVNRKDKMWGISSDGRRAGKEALQRLSGEVGVVSFE